MTTKIEEIWRETLRQSTDHPLLPTGFRLLRIDPDARFDIYGGVDASGFVVLGVGVRSRPPNVEMESSSLDYFRHQRPDGSWLMVLRLKQVGLEPVFGRLCQDLADEANGVEDEKALVDFFGERLSLWRRLFHQGADGLLQIHQVKGLMAELLVLESMLVEAIRSPIEAINGWRGPLDADQDFLFSDKAVEVKAIGPGADCVSISSLAQLDTAVPLQLVVIVLRQAALGEDGATSLNALVARVEEIVAPQPDALALYRGRLLEARYVEHEYYDSVPFEEMSRTTFSVASGFPKLVPGGVSAGIVSATYAISLGAIDAHRETEVGNAG